MAAQIPYNEGMQEVPETLLTEIIELVVGALHPEQVYLFGSHAYGQPHRHSDLDLLVVVADDAGDPEELALAGRRALLGCPIPVDILVYHRSEMDKWARVRCSLPHMVAEKGREVYAARTRTGSPMAPAGQS